MYNEQKEKRIFITILIVLAIFITIGLILDPTILNACDPYGNCY